MIGLLVLVLIGALRLGSLHFVFIAALAGGRLLRGLLLGTRLHVFSGLRLVAGLRFVRLRLVAGLGLVARLRLIAALRSLRLLIAALTGGRALLARLRVARI